jgi:hypothetical protein
MSLAEQLRQEAEEREAKEKAEAEERRKKARASMKRAVRREIPRLVEWCKQQAQEHHDAGHRSCSVIIYDSVAHHAVDQVAEKLRAEGFTVTARAEHTLVRINGDGYAVGGGDPYAVWELSW